MILGIGSDGLNGVALILDLGEELFLILTGVKVILHPDRAKQTPPPLLRHRHQGAPIPQKWCMAAAGVVHRAAMRGDYSGMPLRLRMDSPSIWMV